MIDPIVTSANALEQLPVHDDHARSIAECHDTLRSLTSNTPTGTERIPKPAPAPLAFRADVPSPDPPPAPPMIFATGMMTMPSWLIGSPNTRA